MDPFRSQQSPMQPRQFMAGYSGQRPSPNQNPMRRSVQQEIPHQFPSGYPRYVPLAPMPSEGLYGPGYSTTSLGIEQPRQPEVSAQFRQHPPNPYPYPVTPNQYGSGDGSLLRNINLTDAPGEGLSTADELDGNTPVNLDDPIFNYFDPVGPHAMPTQDEVYFDGVNQAPAISQGQVSGVGPQNMLYTKPIQDHANVDGFSQTPAMGQGQALGMNPQQMFLQELDMLTRPDPGQYCDQNPHQAFLQQVGTLTTPDAGKYHGQDAHQTFLQQPATLTASDEGQPYAAPVPQMQVFVPDASGVEPMHHSGSLQNVPFAGGHYAAPVAQMQASHVGQSPVDSHEASNSSVREQRGKLRLEKRGEGKCDFQSRQNNSCERSAPICRTLNGPEKRCCRCTSKHLPQWRRAHALPPAINHVPKTLQQAKREIYPDYRPKDENGYRNDLTLAIEEGAGEEWQRRFLVAALTPYEGSNKKLQAQQALFNGNVECDDQHHYDDNQVNSRMALLFHTARNFHMGGERLYGIFGDNAGYPKEVAALNFRGRLETIERLLRDNKRIVMDVIQGRGVGALVETPLAYDKRKVTNNAGNEIKKEKRPREEDEEDTLIDAAEDFETPSPAPKRRKIVQPSVPMAGGGQSFQAQLLGNDDPQHALEPADRAFPPSNSTPAHGRPVPLMSRQGLVNPAVPINGSRNIYASPEPSTQPYFDPPGPVSQQQHQPIEPRSSGLPSTWPDPSNGHVDRPLHNDTAAIDAVALQRQGEAFDPAQALLDNVEEGMTSEDVLELFGS